ARHKPAMTSHELHETDPVPGAEGFDLGASDHLYGCGIGALEAETSVDEVNVVVDGLRNADDGDLRGAPLALFDDAHRAPNGAVAADHEQHVDAVSLEGVDHDRWILIAPGGTQQGPSLVVDGVDDLGCEWDGRATARDQPLVAVA